MKEYRSDVTVIGSGIAGLWSAKELVDQGYSVNIVEKSDRLADGATTKNEGWLHAGTYHAVAIEKEDEVMPVVAKTIWSHDEIVRFAPESIDHMQTYAIAASDEIAQKATDRWELANVNFQEVDKTKIADTPLLATDRLSAVFSVKDKSVNSHFLCRKLAQHILAHGGRFFNNAEFLPKDDTSVDLLIGDEKLSLASDHFLVTSGVGTKEVIERVTNQTLPMRFFKAHLLITPRLTTDNYFHLEAGEVGLMNHGTNSIVGVNRDGIELSSADYAVVPGKVQLIHSALMRTFSPNHELTSGLIRPVVCNKPDITGNFGDTQSLDVNVFRPAPNYVCALPGKMTMAPYLAKKAVDMMLLSSKRGSQDAMQMVTTVPQSEWKNQQHVNVSGGNYAKQ